jgi:hypothetical protein
VPAQVAQRRRLGRYVLSMWTRRRNAGEVMTESLGITVQNECYECMVIARDTAEGLPVGKCLSCEELAEARDDDRAYNLHESDRLGEPGKVLTYDTSDEPSASDWVSSQTYSQPSRRKAKMIEKWKDESMELIELSVKFLDPDEPVVTRHEFLPPIAQLMDGGEYEELWELQDTRQRAREVECQWCHILTPKVFNDCQSCDLPLESNVK